MTEVTLILYVCFSDFSFIINFSIKHWASRQSRCTHSFELVHGEGEQLQELLIVDLRCLHASCNTQIPICIQSLSLFTVTFHFPHTISNWHCPKEVHKRQWGEVKCGIQESKWKDGMNGGKGLQLLKNRGTPTSNKFSQHSSILHESVLLLSVCFCNSTEGCRRTGCNQIRKKTYLFLSGTSWWHCGTWAHSGTGKNNPKMSPTCHSWPFVKHVQFFIPACHHLDNMT